ncbi:uncharacterized protein METZ01_LOCUS320177, partial [marine metagenome]
SGKIAENRVLDLFKESYPDNCVRLTEKRNPDWDIECGFPSLADKYFTIEVKYDMYEQRSGNFAIEVFNTNKQKESGLFGTQADLWCHVLSEEIWMAHVEKLRLWTSSNPANRIIEHAGDGNATIWLYAKKEITEALTRIDNLDHSEVREIVENELSGIC